MGALTAVWKTSEPRTLGRDNVRQLSFLGMDLQIPDQEVCSDPRAQVLLHQGRYALDVLRRFVESPLRVRSNTGEAEEFSNKGKHPLDPIHPTADPAKPRHMQQINGAL